MDTTHIPYKFRIGSYGGGRVVRSGGHTDWAAPLTFSGERSAAKGSAVGARNDIIQNAMGTPTENHCIVTPTKSLEKAPKYLQDSGGE